jgi:hypothetical protein
MSNQDWSVVSRLITAYRKTCEHFGEEATWEGFIGMINKLKVEVC